MNHKYQKFLNQAGDLKVSRNEILAPYTYFKIGGPADLFTTVNKLEELELAVRTSLKNKIPYFILGGGSNILISDKGFRGLVIRNRANKISVNKYKGVVRQKSLRVDEAEVYAESGTITNLLVRRTIQEGLLGLEYFLGVPGTVGGAIYNNTHYQQELIGNNVDRVTVLDLQGKSKTYKHDQLDFKYDYSLLQKTGEVITSVTFHLKGGNVKKIWKKAERFAKKRSRTQPLEIPNSGCIFKNPQMSGKPFAKEIASAGQLIDRAGLKGTRIGGAMVSQKHANFIVNSEQATAKDVIELINRIKKVIQKKYHLTLETEIFMIGEF